MKKYGILALVFLFMISCAKVHVKNEIKNTGAIATFKNSGVIFRLPGSSPIKAGMMEKTLSQWMESYKKLKGLVILQEHNKDITLYRSEFDQFLQVSEDDDFMKYKSLGIISQYLRSNGEVLKKLITDNNLDSLIIYEVDPALSAEMQNIEFTSMIIIVDRNLKVEYLDRQDDSYETNEYDRDIMHNHLLDVINYRFLDMMLKLKYLKKV